MSSSASRRAPNSGWWRGGVIYQIYPRSFQDDNGDGIGDLRGITRRLDHVARLGVDAIWLSPFFKSPMADYGYDVSDYCDVDPMFGRLEDFRALVERAHGLGLKVMIDQVLSHSSDQHPWFKESRASRDNPRADWYVWADARPDGTPPNNWLSVFGGSAWQWDTRRRQYYLHNFLVSQPDLNFHNPAVQDALLDTVKFWLELGVDGYRLDAINFCFHDAQLRDNPARGQPAEDDPTTPAVNPYGWQWHTYDKSQPDALGFLRRLRELVDRYPDTTMVGEIGDDNGLTMVPQYTSGIDKLHMAYCFDLLAPRCDAPHLHEVFQAFHDVVGDGWPCWALSNHDVARVASRWGGPTPSPAFLRLMPALLLSLRGSVCIYQGEELGLPEAELALADLRDPYGIAMWPEYKGRDGCRTPMAWSSTAPHLGFNDGRQRPWLPASESHRALAVDVQEADPQSLLQHWRRMLRWRRGQPALRLGTSTLLPSHSQVLAYVREHEGERILCAFNMSGDGALLDMPPGHDIAAQLDESGATGASVDAGVVRFAPHGVLFARLR